MSRCPLSDTDLPADLSAARCIRCKRTIDPGGSGWYWCSGHAPAAATRAGEETWNGEDENEGVSARFPGYQIEGTLGVGGGGQVFRALSEHTGERVALKVVADATRPQLRVRFQREIASMASLEDDGVISVLDVGYTANGEPWFVMPLIDGPSLADVLRGGALLPEDEAAHLLSTVARTLHRVHEQGMVHRDVKPGNILLQTDGTPILADLGLALNLKEDDRLTRTHQPLGTPRYMAPEQRLAAVGDWRKVDIYALGVILYECIGGTVGPIGTTHSMPDLSAASAELVWIARRASATAPQERYRTPADLADDLSAWLDARSRWSVALRLRSREWYRRNRLWALLVTQAALLLAVVAIGTAGWAAYTDAARERDAMLAWEQLQTRVALSSPEQAAALLAQFADEPTWQETAAEGQAWLMIAAQAKDDEARKQALGRALLSTEEPSVRGAVFSELLAMYHANGDWAALSVLVDAVLADPGLAPGVEITDRLQADIALAFGDIPGALPHLSAEDAAILGPLAMTRPASFGPGHHLLDPDGDGTDEVVLSAPGDLVLGGRLVRMEQADTGHRLSWVTEAGLEHLLTLPQPIVFPPVQIKERWFVAANWDGALYDVTGGVSRKIPGSDKRGAFIRQLLGADLDGNGTEELIAIVGPPSGFSIEVFDVSGDNPVRLDQLRVGFLNTTTVLPTPDGARIVGAISNEFAAPELLGEAQPQGGPERIVVASMADGRLRLEQELPHHGGGFVHFHTVDLDGRAPKELAVMQLAFDTVLTSIYRYDDGRLHRVGTLGGFHSTLHEGGYALLGSRRAGQLDSLLLDVFGETLLLGEGDTPLPQRERPEPIDPSGPGFFTQLGLHHAAALAWERRASQGNAASSLAAASVSWAAAGEHALASHRAEEAARCSSPPDPDLLSAAADHAHYDRDFSRALALVEELNQPDDQRRTELAGLLNPTLEEQFTTPLHEAWQILVPQAVSQDLARGQLTVRGITNLGPILRMPLRRTEGPLALWVEGTWERSERFGGLDIVMRTEAHPEGWGPWLGMSGISNTRQLRRRLGGGPLCEFSDDTDVSTPIQLTMLSVLWGPQARCWLTRSLGEDDAARNRHWKIDEAFTHHPSWELVISSASSVYTAETRLVLDALRLTGVEPVVEDFTPPSWASQPMASRLRLEPSLQEQADPDDIVASRESVARGHRQDSEVIEQILALPPLDGQPERDRAVFLAARAEALWNHGRITEAQAALAKLSVLPCDATWSFCANGAALSAEIARWQGNEAAMQDHLARLVALTPDRGVAQSYLWARPGLKGIVLE